MLQVLENFMGYSNQKPEKKNFKPFWSYIDFGGVLNILISERVAFTIMFEFLRNFNFSVKKFRIKKITKMLMI